MSHFSRRNFLKAMGAGTGALLGTRIPGASLISSAWAATEPTSVVAIYLHGGIHQIFTGADSVSARCGVTATNSVTIGGGVVIDKTLADAIPPALYPNVASVGILHNSTTHRVSEPFFAEGRPLMLANAIGGSGTIKAAVVGNKGLPTGVFDVIDIFPKPVNGVSLESIMDMKSVIGALGGGEAVTNAVDRPGMAHALAAAKVMSRREIDGNPDSLALVDPAFDTAIATARKSVQAFSLAEFNTAYGLKGTAIFQDRSNYAPGFGAKLAAAELMIRSGTNFVLVREEPSTGTNHPWDGHSASHANNARERMSKLTSFLRTFLSRMVEGTMADRNVVVAIFGDFHTRDGDGQGPGGHNNTAAALLIGKTVKNATTGRTDKSDIPKLPSGTPGIVGLWQCLAAAARVDKSLFGANPHDVLV